MMQLSKITIAEAEAHPLLAESGICRGMNNLTNSNVSSSSNGLCVCIGLRR